MSQDTILMDSNSICHAAHNGARLTVGGMEVQAIFNTLRMMRGFIQAYPDWRPWALWDGKAAWRKELLPTYKENRVAKNEKEVLSKDAYKKQVPVIKACLACLGIKQALVLDAEADDIAGYLTRTITGNGGSVVLVSGDGDWLQLVKPGVLWFDPIRDNKVSHTGLLDFTGYFDPLGYLQGKALQGDSSDCIPGVGGIGEKGAPEFLAQFKTVEEFWRRVDSGEFKPNKKAHINLASPEGRAKFRNNMKLMNLIDAAKPDPKQVVITRPHYDEAKFRKICERLAFNSFLKDFEKFIGPFRALQGETA